MGGDGISCVTESQDVTGVFTNAVFEIWQKKAGHNANAHGFHESWNDGEKLNLIHCEVSELTEALRKKERTKDEHCPEFFNDEIEAADTLIRLLDFCYFKGIRLGPAMQAKHAFNVTRPHKHGKKF